MTWTRPMYDGGSDVTGYVIEILEEGTEQWYRATQKILTTNKFTATGLTSNKKYSFRVAAVNALGTGEFSEGSAETSPSDRVGRFCTGCANFGFTDQITDHQDLTDVLSWF